MSTRTLLVAAACIALPARGQVTVTYAMFEAGLNLTGTLTSHPTQSSAALLALAAQEGANQTWDFTGLAYDPPEVVQISPVTPPVPGSSDPHLAQATHITRYVADDSTFYIYHLLAPTESAALGLVGPNILIRYVPSERNAVIPLTFGATWTASFESQFEPAIPGATFTTQSSGEVVGWGTLVTPAGSAQALMARIESTTTISFPPLPPIISNTVQVLFTDYGNMNASVHIPQGFPAEGEYNVFSGGTANAPTPEDGGLSIAVDGAHPIRLGAPIRLVYALDAPARPRVELFDPLGRLVADFQDVERPAGVYRLSWSAAPAPGAYIARLTAGGGTASRVVTISR